MRHTIGALLTVSGRPMWPLQEDTCKQLATAPAPTAEANRSAGGDLMAGHMLLDVSAPRWRILLCDDMARAVTGGTCRMPQAVKGAEAAREGPMFV